MDTKSESAAGAEAGAGTDAAARSEAIDDLPPSAKLVFKVLEYNGALTQKGIVEESMLSARTVRYALERLEEIDVVGEDVYFADARQNLYDLQANADGECLVDQAAADD